MSIPSDCKFTEEHEWAKVEGTKVTVGISDYAQRELGDVVYVELPEVGREVSKGDSFSNVESVKAVSDIYAPIDGKILSVNDTLESQPEQINESPHQDGWLVVIEASDVSQLEGLMDADAYASYVAELSK